ncbi:STAS domain-containing protein [Mycolicibacterium rufum]|uniref:STAS domain-containing protein n=1 Tax=Mycolicibacterium rufum TaxID=318424 RepID=A0A9X2YES9_9MYCO|nr:STAS domain-containing protein [Mycolicibacterium rufum]KGI67421.1 hypothetical protein EU78_08170 [Mycolicibacterium rufum]MCV7072749.1 STAS domain-containing protein [Mycolicibacterium rufum]ULP38365.1 STAS domain-containing protein [Mycolicibacterium rufum]
MATSLTVDITADDGTLRFAVTGEIDLSNIAAFRQALADAGAEAARRAMPLVVDMAGVAYLDSAAINALYASADHIATLIAPPLLMTTLRVSGLAEIVAVHAAASDANP